MRRRLLLVLVCALFTGCAHMPSTATDEANCLAGGGRWAAVTMLQAACHWPTTDTGRACADDAQCQGLCVATGEAYRPSACAQDASGEICSDRRALLLRVGDTATGICSSERQDAMPANCMTHIVNGRIVIEDCAD